MTLLQAIRAELPHLRLLEAEPLSKHTSFHIGGPAAMAFPDSAEALKTLFALCRQYDRAPVLLGAGTNVLAPDQGLDRLVICTRELAQIRDLGGGRIEAQSGVSLARLACFARDLGLTGLEFAHGIPGTVGGGVYMNAGAYGGELCQVVVKTTAMLPDGSIWTVEGDEHRFSYRHSVFEERSAVVLSSVFQLAAGDKEAISARMQELSQKRRASQPLELPSAGSTFKRPSSGYAAALIDRAGLKGKGVGGAAVSEKHAGFVVNLGGATAADVLATMTMIQEKVYESSGIHLEPEVRIW